MSQPIILIHGLGRTGRSMAKMARFLSNNGFCTHIFNYDSRRLSLNEIVVQLQQLIAQIKTPDEHPTQIHFVTHSLGAIVLRALLGAESPHAFCIGRCVMLAPPNKGSEIIDFWRQSRPLQAFFTMVMGKTAITLHTGRDSLPNQLPKLEQHCVGLIAGTRSVEFWFYPLFHQVNDGKVGINNVTLGATHPAIQIHATHTFIMNHADTQKQTLHFLQNGDFLSVTSNIDAPHTKTVKI